MSLRDKLLLLDKRRRPLGSLAAGLLAVVILAGCEGREEIARYTVDKPPPVEPLARANPHADLATEAPPAGEPTDRTLGAIVPSAPQGWFFKLTGPKDPVAAHEEAFTAFLKSVQFAGGKPSWTLPEGWSQQPGNSIRYATLTIPAEGKPLEVTVVALPNSGEDDENYVLANVNRWRGQLRLGPIEAQQLAAETTKVEMTGATAVLVNLVGHAAPNTMGRPPFASGAPDGN